MVACPGAIPVTTPSLVTIATAGFELDQKIKRPANTLPFTSVAVDESRTLPPCSMAALAGVMLTEVTGTATMVRLVGGGLVGGFDAISVGAGFGVSVVIGTLGLGEGGGSVGTSGGAVAIGA